MNPKLVTLLTRIAETLERIERQHAPAAPEPLPLLEAIARTYGTAQAVEVAAQVEIVRAEAETAAATNGTRRRNPRRWSVEFPEMREMLRNWNRHRAKADYYRSKLETETDETARLFFEMELQRSTDNAHRERSAYDKLVKERNREARQNQT